MKEEIQSDATASGIEACETQCIHEDMVSCVKSRMPAEELLAELGDFFKTFGDSTRIRIVSALMYGELCVCDIAATLGASESAVSHQLRVLRQAKIVRSRRDGKQIFYSIDDEHVGILVSVGLEHLREGR
ncbi:metalloregulator ArsR/SmtB family transcription factor [Treponema zuelzerae]|jgi:DNA-binding transcriptional ArsR family regulator|uniref:Metalloregulator ArsR/SmtB family transcription factor n=1 Tax=Teretinema zuelzerae TaxID=156 RepID=A0AAE3EIP0_9SPIR|nr:winged helix-turn-helix transcriptional regulator [Spirochaetales bacterium]MCD1655434.1 metalloregulator ArsR/SmtB family transcription factor [Teretinema zuelzerae]